ncbi:MAG: hypothetical protein KGJ60_05945 [Verrucomicrobiota bacterium]|nr:hypothetical protein [Verrucomicrobiota bacterium]
MLGPVGTGRRRPLTRLAMVACGGLLAATALNAAPIYMLRYGVTNAVFHAGMVQSDGRLVAGINDDGDVCGTFTLSADQFTGVATDSVFLLRPDGSVYNLFPNNISPAVQSAYANGLTPRRSDGSLQIAGTVVQADGFQRGAIWTVAANGTYQVNVLTNLVLPTNSWAPGEQSFGEANSINSSGFVVGDGQSGSAQDGLSWTPPYGPPDAWWWGDMNTAVAVNDQGVVLVNGSFEPNGAVGAALISGANMTYLPDPADPSTGFGVWAYAMSGSHVAGEAVWGTNQIGFPFIWNVGDTNLTELPPPAGQAYDSDAEADVVNTNGEIAGLVNQKFVVWRKENGGYKGYQFDNLLVAQPGFQTAQVGQPSYAIAINDRGDIALNYAWGGYVGDYAYYTNFDAVLVYQPVTDGVVQFATNQAAVFTNSMIACSVERTNATVQVPVELVRANGYTNPVTVDYATADGDALARTDYVAQSGTLTWGANQSGVLYIPIQLVSNDSYWPFNKTFYVNLSGVSGAQAGITNAAVIITSHDDQETVTFTNQVFQGNYWGYNVRAGATNVVVTLARTGPLDGTMQISGFQISDGSAYNGWDYQSVNPVPITWNPGQGGSVSISIPLLDSTNLTTTKYFYLQANGDVDGQKSVSDSGTVNILPVDQTPPFQFDTSVPLVKSNVLDLVSLIEQGVTVLIQSSSNLVDWQTVTQLQCTNGIVQFDPAILTGPKARFYRAVVQ